MFHPFQKPAHEECVSETAFSCVRDGLTIRGTEYRPVGSHLLPAAIVSHGFMADQNSVRHYAQRLAETGYAAYCFDFNGGSGANSKSGGKTTEMSVLTEAADLEAVMDYVIRLPYINQTGIFLMGCSQGGFVSALTAAKRGDMVSRLALFYPALCIPDDARAGKMMFARFDPHNVPELVNCGPMKLGRRYVTDVLDMDPFAEIVPYPGPVLIVHGTRDHIVHPDYAYRACEAYHSRGGAGASVRLEMIEGGGHGFLGGHDRRAIEKLVQFAKEEGAAMKNQ